MPLLLVVIYLGGLFGQINSSYRDWMDQGGMSGDAMMGRIDIGPLYCFGNAFTTDGLKGILFVLVAAAAILVLLKLHNRFGSKDFDDRNFARSKSGVYGTAGWMTNKEMKSVLEVTSPENANGIILGQKGGSVKVIIPAEEVVEPPEDFRDRSPGDVMHYMITKRLGAEVDYIVKGVDKEGIAAASHLEAMASKRKEYYFGSDRDGNNLLYEGINAEARVVSVIRAGIFVDLFGAEAYIPLRELSYQRGVDAAAQFQPGQRVLVKMLSIDRSNRSKILVSASVKQATENPYEKALRKYVPGSRYVGTVSMVDTNGVFVSLDGGIDCLCSYPKRGRPPRGSRVTVRIIGINNESNRIWGAITHMTTAR